MQMRTSLLAQPSPHLDSSISPVGRMMDLPVCRDQKNLEARRRRTRRKEPTVSTGVFSFANHERRFNLLAVNLLSRCCYCSSSSPLCVAIASQHCETKKDVVLLETLQQQCGGAPYKSEAVDNNDDKSLLSLRPLSIPMRPLTCLPECLVRCPYVSSPVTPPATRQRQQITTTNSFLSISRL